jgi:hypothetical protein
VKLISTTSAGGDTEMYAIHVTVEALFKTNVVPEVKSSDRVDADAVQGEELANVPVKATFNELPVPEYNAVSSAMKGLFLILEAFSMD